MKFIIVLFAFIFISGLAQNEKAQLDSVFHAHINDDESVRMDKLNKQILEIRKTNFDLAQRLADTLIKLTNKPKFEMQYGLALGNSAVLASMNDQDELMVSRYLEAIDVYKNYSAVAPDSLQEKISSNISACYNNIAQVYLDKKDYDLAMEFYKNSLEEVLEANDSLGISIRCYNISDTYKRMEEYDSAFKYIYWSKRIEELRKDDEGLAYAHEGLAKIYNEKEEFLKALQHIDSALIFVENIGDDFFKLDITQMKSNVLISIGGKEQAIEVLELGVLKSKQVGYRKFTIDAYKKLGQLYSEAGNYKKAYYSMFEYNKFREEVENEVTAKKIEEFQILYETEQKDKEIANLATQNQLKEEANKNLLAKQEAEKSASRIIYIALGSGVVLLGFIGLLLFRASQRRKKTNDFLRSTNENLKFKNDKIESQAKQIADSIAYARNIQNAILPLKSEMEGSLSEHFVYYVPKDIVSGDFYWYHELKNQQKALIAVADCTGHGVPGAFMSIVGHALLEKIVKQLGITEPNEILDQLGFELNNTLQKGGESDVKDGMDIAMISIDLKESVIEYAGARNQLIFISKGQLTEFKGDRIDLGKGKTAAKKFTKHQIPYVSGDSFYMFTDGYVDQKGGEQGKKFFMPPFRDLLSEISSLPIAKQQEIIDVKFKEWKGTNYEQMDDVLVMGVRL